MPARKEAPLTGDRFAVEVEGTAVLVTGVTLPAASIEPAQRGPGNTRYGPVILRRPLSADRMFSEWWKAALNGSSSGSKSGRVTLLTPDMKAAAAWKFSGARPVTLTLSPLDASSPAMVIETLELTVQTFERDA